MKRKLLSLLALALATQINVNAQSLYQFVFTGTSSTTDASGKIITWKINNAALLKEAALLGGSSDTSNLALAYHVQGSDLGDTIDIIDRNTGAVLKTLLGLYFGEDFGRTELASASGRQIKRLEYIYTDQNSHSLGSALLTSYYWLGANGQTNAMAVLGNMQWVVTPNTLYTNTQIRTGSFYTTKPYTFK